MNDDTSLAVAMYPEIVNGEWTGKMSIVLEESGMDEIDEDSAESLQMFCGMVATTVEMMNNDPQLMVQVQNEYMKRLIEFDAKQEVVEKAKRYANVGGNVFQLHPHTKTEGNA